MKGFYIQRGKYRKIPTRLSEVTTAQLINVMPLQERIEQLTKEKEATDSEQERLLISLQILDTIDRIICDISDIEYQELSNVPLGPKRQIHNYALPIMQLMRFQPNAANAKREFKFKHNRYLMFEFGDATVKQMHWFFTHWKDAYSKTTQEVSRMNFEELPRLLAILAFKKNEVNTMLQNNEQVPYEVKANPYESFGKLVEERTELFKSLPLNILFSALDFFFANSKNLQQIITTYTNQTIKTL